MRTTRVPRQRWMTTVAEGEALIRSDVHWTRRFRLAKISRDEPIIG